MRLRGVAQQIVPLAHLEVERRAAVDLGRMHVPRRQEVLGRVAVLSVICSAAASGAAMAAREWFDFDASDTRKAESCCAIATACAELGAPFSAPFFSGWNWFP